MALIWAALPTRLTDSLTLMVERMPLKNRAVSRKSCPSVMDMTLVGMNTLTSPACVSMSGSAVRLPPPFLALSFAARSKRWEWR